MLNISASRKNKSPKSAKLNKRKKIIAITSATIIGLSGVGYATAAADQSNLERYNVPIVISEIDDEISMDYHTNSREIGATIKEPSHLNAKPDQITTSKNSKRL